MTEVSESISAAEARPRSRIAVRFEVIEPLFVLADALIIITAAIICYTIYDRAIGSRFGNFNAHASLGLMASLSYGLVARQLGLYRLSQLLERERDDGRVWAAWSLTVLLLAVALFLLKSSEDISRIVAVCFFVLGGSSLIIARRAAKRRLRVALVAGAIVGRRAVVIGRQGELAQCARRDLLISFGLDEVDRIVLPRDGLTNHSSGLQEAHIDAILQRVRAAPVEEIVLALSWSDEADMELLLDRLRVIPLPVRLLPDRAMAAVLRRQNLTSPRSYMVEMQRAPLSRFECAAKRLLDVTVAATSLILLAPLLIAAMISIKLESRGPVIFRQRRRGFNGRSFVIYKFRTMKVLEDGATVVQARKEDPRITRVGRLLRETSIDELPQLFNVLQGNMSIVGPRPHALAHDYEYGKIIENYAFRHHVKPGITGWAQIQGYRGGTPRIELMEQRVTLDLWYIDNWSIALDVYIILRTCLVELLRRRNAY